ncbi:type III polyketide synthase [Planctomycetota bacterium]|nr:type III polyketide synthase [Planctomycetota bacterium]
MLIQGMGTTDTLANVHQESLASFAGEMNATNDRQRRLIKRLYEQTTIENRGSVLINSSDPEMEEISAASKLSGFRSFYASTAKNGKMNNPTTCERMAMYERKALPLAVDATRQALIEAGMTAEMVTHVVIVTCTGFASPGLDIRLIHELGMKVTTERTAIGFMGCHGAVNGLRTARAITQADPSQIVLVCCVELCTLHYQYGWDEQAIVANSLFSDGAAAAVVTGDIEVNSTCPDKTTNLPNIMSFKTTVMPDSENAMTWRMGANGFLMTLSPTVPNLVKDNLFEFIKPWLLKHGLMTDDIQGWAIHPGGPRIIRAVEKALSLPDHSGDISRNILKKYGNISSPTLLFILKKLINVKRPRPWVALAFGPGLVIEAALIT